MIVYAVKNVMGLVRALVYVLSVEEEYVITLFA